MMRYVLSQRCASVPVLEKLIWDHIMRQDKYHDYITITEMLVNKIHLFRITISKIQMSTSKKLVECQKFKKI